MIIITTIFIFILGLAIGSFLNVCIDRLSFEQSIGGRSYCDHCKKKLGWIDLLPVVSWVYLQGKSRCCRKKISLWYPAVELITGIAFVFIWHYVPETLLLRSEMMTNLWQMPAISSLREILRFTQDDIVKIFYLVIVSALIVIFFADVKYHIIPDEATIVLVVVGVLQMFLMGEFFSYFFGAIIVSSIFYALYFFSGGRAMGFGDVKLAYAMGLLLGIKSGLVAVYLGFLMGGVASVFLLLLRKKKVKSHIAFGPFLVLGTFVMLFYESAVLKVIGRLLGFS